MTRGLGPLGEMSIVVILGMTLIVGFTLFYGEVFTTYGVTDYQNATNGTKYTESFAKLNKTTNDIGNNLRSSSATSNDPFLVLFSGAFEGLKNAFNILDAVKDVASASLDFISTYAGVNVGTIATILLAALGFFFAWAFLEGTSGRQI